MIADDAAKSDLALACRVLAAEGLGDYIWGHVSVRAEQPGAFWLKGAGLGLEEITPDDLVLMDLDGNILAGHRPRHVEWPIHAGVLRARPDVNAVVHSHAPASVAVSCIEVDLEPLCHEAIRWMPAPPRFTETSDLIDSPDLGRAVADRMGDGPGVLLRNHGMVVGTGDVRSAAIMAIFLERACRTQISVMAIGAGYAAAPARDAASRRDKMNVPRQFDALWSYLVRRLDD